MTPKEQIYTELVDGLRGMDPCIGSGTQVELLFRSQVSGFLVSRLFKIIQALPF